MYDIIVGRNEKDREAYGDKGVILLGKHFVKMGRVTSLSNPVHMDMTRSHVVFVCGKRGGGKCVRGDTLISLADGSKVPIRELEYDNREILCLDENEQIVKQRKIEFYKRTVKKTMKLTLASKKTIILTPEHPLLTQNGWIPADKIPINTVIATPQDRYESVQSDSEQIILQSAIHWDNIIFVEEICQETEVYDMTIPKYHNFIANDIIVHNSYTMGVIAEGMADLPKEIKENISIIMLDTMGIYWTMKYPNKKDKKLLDEWGLQGKGLDVKIYTPTGYYQKYKDEGIPTDKPFAIKPGELGPDDWLITLGVQPHEPVGVLIERVIHELTEQKGDNYSMQEIEDRLMNDQDADHNTKLAAKNQFSNVKSWGLFSEEATKLSDLAVGGQITILDVSCYATMPGSWNIKNLVIGLVAEKLFIQRMISRKDEEFRDVHKSVNPFSDEDREKQDFPLVWLVIDEAHEFLPVTGKTLATDPLVTILREGRQPGISLILATQQPGKIHTDVMTQADTVISHRITAKLDTDALGMLTQSYMRKGLVEELDQLPRVKGAAVIFDDTNERLYPIRVRPRFTWHGGEAPTAMKTKEGFKF